MNVNDLPTLDSLGDNGYILYSNGGNELYRVKKGTFLRGMTGGVTYYGTTAPDSDMGKDGDLYSKVALRSLYPNIRVSRHGEEAYTLPAEQSTDGEDHTGTLYGWRDQKEGGTEYENVNGTINSFYPITLPPSPVLETYIDDKKYFAGGQQSYVIPNYVQGVEMSLSFDLSIIGDVQFTQPSGGTDDFYGLYFPIDFPEPGEPDSLGPVYAVSDDVPFGVLADINESVRGIRFYKDYDTHHYEFTYTTDGDFFYFAFNFGGVLGDFKNGNSRVYVSNIRLAPLAGYNNITDVYVKDQGMWVKDDFAHKDDLIISDLLPTGELIATIIYDGTEYQLKAPQPQGAHVSVIPQINVGNHIATIYIDDEEVKLYSPASGGDYGFVNGSLTETASGNPLVTTGNYTIENITLKNGDDGTFTTGPGVYLVDVVAHIVQNDNETINVSGNETFEMRLYPSGPSAYQDAKMYISLVYRQRADVYNGETFDCCYSGTGIAYVSKTDGTPKFTMQFRGYNFNTAYGIKECTYSISMYKIGEY